MNKQQHHLLLLLLASALSSNAMDLADTPNTEDTQDRFAILRPQLSSARKERLEAAIDWLDEDVDGVDTHVSAYLAAVELEIDEHPCQRDGTLVATRKKLWQKIKDLSEDQATAQLAVNYVTGSEDEQENTAAQLKARVLRRDRHLKEQAKRARGYSAQMQTHKDEEEKLTTKLNTLLAQKQPLEQREKELALEDLDLLINQNGTELASDALQRLHVQAEQFVKEEPLLAGTPTEKLEPTYSAQLAQKKDDLAVQVAQICVARDAMEKQIAPVTEQEKQLKDQMQSNSEAQARLEQLIEYAQHIHRLTHTDKDKLIAALDERIESCTDTTQKTKLKVARAQADGTYSYTRWLAGYYN